MATLEQLVEALCDEMDGAVREHEFRLAGRPGMHVPFHGDFASAVQIPSVMVRFRWWSRELRAAMKEVRDAEEG